MSYNYKIYNNPFNDINIYHHRSFFQSVCVLGYCLLPTTIALIVCKIILLFEQTTYLFIIRFIVVIIGFSWATYGNYQYKFNYLFNK